MWTGRLTACCELLLLALVLHPGGGGAVTATTNFKVNGRNVVRAGRTATLTCVDPNQAYTSFKWVRNGKEIPDQTSDTLILQNVTKQDAGYYQCGTAVSDVDGKGLLLHVFAVGDTLPDPDIEHVGVPVCGRNFVLKCLFLRDYIPSADTVYTWYKDDKEIKDQSNQTLSFTRVVDTDTGAYRCTAWEGDKNTTSPRSPPFHLTPLMSPKVTINKLPVEAIRGGNLTLNCEVTEAFPSVPDDGYTWSFSRAPDAQNRSLDGNGSSLFLGPLTTDHSGQYFCEARINNIFRLLTLAGQASVTVDVVYLARIYLTSNLEVNEGDQVTFSCGVDSHPTAHLSWTVNGQKLRHVTDNLDHYFIPSAACSDSNNYTCAASNPDLPGLEINATVQLTVLCRQVTTHPHFPATDSRPETALEIPVTTHPHFPATDSRPETAVNIPDGQPWMTATCILVAFIAIVILAVAICYCRKIRRGCKGQRVPSSCLRFKKGGTLKKKHHANERPSDANEPLMDTETFQTTSGVETPRQSQEPDRKQTPTNRRKHPREKVTKSDEVQKSNTLKKTPPTEGQKVIFEEYYRKGTLYTIPPLQADTETVGDGDKHLDEDNAKALVIKLLQDTIKTTHKPDDPPIFLFTQSLPSHVHAIVYHEVYGVIIIKTKAQKSFTASELKQIGKQLMEAKTRLLAEHTDQLHQNGLTTVLFLPNVQDVKNLECIEKKGIHVVCGKKKEEYKAWLQKLPTGTQPSVWGPERDSHVAFRSAVCKYLCVKSCGNDGDPSHWLVTSEQASILNSTNKLIHTWGPPGSGKSLLLEDRVRRWLMRGKTVLLVVCDPSCPTKPPLWDHLRRMALTGLPEDTGDKLLLCKKATDIKRKADSLKRKNISDICVAIDNISCEFFNILLEACDFSTSVYTAGRNNFTDAHVEKIQNLGGRRFQLSHSFRCSDDILKLARELLPDDTSKDLEAFQSSFIQRTHTTITVADCGNHRASKAEVLVCGDCQTWLKSSLSPLKDGLTMEDQKWKTMVILLTGDWGSDTKAKPVLHDHLRREGVPAVLDNQLTCLEFSPPPCRRCFQLKPGNAAAQEMMDTGVDTKGHPAVHMVPAVHFRGLEKPCVLIVHYDWRDDHPDHQKQESRDARLAEHRQQLHLAVTRCQTELAVLLLSPSPAAAPLMKYTPGGEQPPADAIVAVETTDQSE